MLNVKYFSLSFIYIYTRYNLDVIFITEYLKPSTVHLGNAVPRIKCKLGRGNNHKNFFLLLPTQCKQRDERNVSWQAMVSALSIASVNLQIRIAE